LMVRWDRRIPPFGFYERLGFVRRMTTSASFARRDRVRCGCEVVMLRVRTFNWQNSQHAGYSLLRPEATSFC
jgi:hypothetical protein